MIDEDERAGGGPGHPLPGSEEAREDEVPEHLVREKGRGDDAPEPLQPAGDPVEPGGGSYEIRRDQEAHQDRGQSFADPPDGG